MINLKQYTEYKNLDSFVSQAACSKEVAMQYLEKYDWHLIMALYKYFMDVEVKDAE